jgi:hypothetical protein
MRRFVLAVGLACAVGWLPAASHAEDCFECVVGIWDDEALTSSQGTILAGEPKDVFVGVKLHEGVPSISGVEFSIAGLADESLVLLGAIPLGPRALVWGLAPAPRDTSDMSTGIGGVTVAFSECVPSNQAILKLTLYTTQDLTDKILQVKRSYPSTNPNFHSPVFMACDPPFFTMTRMSGGCFILNPSGNVQDCLHPQVVAVQDETWGGVKNLFR